MKVAVGSNNPVKVKAVENVFSRIFGNVTVEARKVASGVPPQPFGNDTVKGAITRAKNAYKSGSYDYGVGIEAGLSDVEGFVLDVQFCADLRRGRRHHPRLRQRLRVPAAGHHRGALRPRGRRGDERALRHPGPGQEARRDRLFVPRHARPHAADRTERAHGVNTAHQPEACTRNFRYPSFLRAGFAGRLARAKTAGPALNFRQLLSSIRRHCL